MKLSLSHALIADVWEDTEKGRRTIDLIVNEEDFFNMLDEVKPKNIIKYLDMRGIQHRAPSEINIYQCNKQKPSQRTKRKIKRILEEQDRLKSMIKQITSK